MKLRKLMASVTGIAVVAMLFAGCGGDAPSSTSAGSDQKSDGGSAAVTDGYHTAKDPYNGDSVIGNSRLDYAGLRHHGK